MNDLLFSANTIVDQALGQSPLIVKVFIQNETACVGCYLARFCTLEDVAKTYGLSLDHFIKELRQIGPSQNIS
jgi:hybrid cluster-associated redox disulfide protein